MALGFLGIFSGFQDSGCGDLGVGFRASGWGFSVVGFAV